MDNVIEEALRNESFRQIYEYGIDKKLIIPFPQEFFEEMKYHKINFLNCTLYDYFKNGDNVGFCLQACEYLSEMFSEYEIYKGILPALKGTKRSVNGEHAWLISDGKIFDTSLLLIIDENLSELLGYNPQGLIKSKTNKKFKTN